MQFPGLPPRGASRDDVGANHRGTHCLAKPLLFAPTVQVQGAPLIRQWQSLPKSKALGTSQRPVLLAGRPEMAAWDLLVSHFLCSGAARFQNNRFLPVTTTGEGAPRTNEGEKAQATECGHRKSF